MQKRRLGWWLMIISCGPWLIPACTDTRNPVGTQQWIRTELYFGLSKSGGVVTEAEWQDFLDREITPNFPDGLTLADVHGQWKNSAGTIVKEKTKMVIILHPNRPRADEAIERIRKAYRQRFGQESVLMAQWSAEASF